MLDAISLHPMGPGQWASALTPLGLVLFLYLAPSLIAFLRGADNRWGILFTNLLLGWTVILWFSALVGALTGSRFTGQMRDAAQAQRYDAARAQSAHKAYEGERTRFLAQPGEQQVAAWKRMLDAEFVFPADGTLLDRAARAAGWAFQVGATRDQAIGVARYVSGGPHGQAPPLRREPSAQALADDRSHLLAASTLAAEFEARFGLRPSP